MADSTTGRMQPLTLRSYLLPLLLFIAGLLLRFALLFPTRFDGLYGQDSYAYYDCAAQLRAALADGHPLPVFFWPLGYPALLAITETLFGAQPQTGQILNVLLGAALAPLVYVLARGLRLDRRGALIAGILMVICGQALQSSLVIMSDIPALFWALLSAVLLSHYLESGTAWSLPLAVFTLALAGITRWLYLVLAVPCALVLLWTWQGRIRWRISLLSVLAASLILIPQLAFNRMNADPVIDHAWVEGWSPTNAFRQVFDNIDGHFEYAKWNALFYAEPFYDPYYLAPIFTPFLLIGLVVIVRQRCYRLFLLLVGWILLPYLFLVGVPYQNIRFSLIIFPPIAVLVGLGLVQTIDWLQMRFSHRWGTIALPPLLLLGSLHTLTTAVPTITTFLTNQTRDKDTALWAAAQIPPGSTLYTFGLTLTLKHETSLHVLDVYYETPATLLSNWTPGKDDYLLLNMWDINHQWIGREPEIAYNWLLRTRGLIRIDRYEYYTLYKVRG